MAYAGKSGQEHFQPPETPTAGAPRARATATGLLIGLVVGATAALLLAPREGAALRHSARRRLRRLGLRGQDAWLDLRDELRRAGRKARRARRRAMAEAEPLAGHD